MLEDDMASNLAQIMAALGGDLESPSIVADIDKVVLNLLELRKIAVSLHGETPAAPTVTTQIETEGSLDQRINEKGRVIGTTIESLIRRYKAHENSPYKKLRHRTRQGYDSMCRRINSDHGSEPLAGIKARTILEWHKEWSQGGVTMAHGLIGMLRGLVHFGAKELEDKECERLSMFLHTMRFKTAEKKKSRREPLTEAHADMIRAQAHKMDLHSIALAQALQFDCQQLGQRDVTGEWIPIRDPGTSDIFNAKKKKKWVRGLRWNEIENLVLRHDLSRGGGSVEVPLSKARMVMEEFDLYKAARNITELPTSGPVIVREKDKLPWSDHDFRKAWRKVADACGIPREVFNMDSRFSEETSSEGARKDTKSMR